MRGRLRLLLTVALKDVGPTAGRRRVRRSAPRASRGSVFRSVFRSVRLLGRYLNSETEVKRLHDLCQWATSEHVERSPVPAGPRIAKLSSAVQVEIAQCYQAGERPVDLAREYGISEWRVQELRKRFGLAKHPISMTSDEIDVAVLLFSEGLSFNKIGARVGRDPKTVAKELRLRGVSP
jgi:hypothetical protein